MYTLTNKRVVSYIYNLTFTMIVIENGTINININIVFKQDCPELFLEILYIMFYNSSGKPPPPQ